MRPYKLLQTIDDAERVSWNEYGVDERTHATVKVFGAGAENKNVKRETGDRQTDGSLGRNGNGGEDNEEALERDRLKEKM